jgi:hypothetical protein
MAIIQGKAKYAFINEPNVRFEPTYTINLIVDDAKANEFASRGHNIKQLDEGPSIVFKRKVDGPNGMKRSAPRLFDENKNEVELKVGDGSEVRIQYNEYSGENKYGPYTGLDLQAVQLLKWLPPKSQDGDELLADMPSEEF